MRQPVSEVIKRIRVIAKKYGIDPKLLLGDDGAAFEVQPAMPAKPANEPSPKRKRENELRQLRWKMTPEQLQAHKAATLAEKSARYKDAYRKHQQPENGDTPDAGPKTFAALHIEDDLNDIYRS